MTAIQRILRNTERWNETVVTPSLSKPHELICTPNRLENRDVIARVRRLGYWHCVAELQYKNYENTLKVII